MFAALPVVGTLILSLLAAQDAAPKAPPGTGGIKPARPALVQTAGLLFRAHWYDGRSYPYAVYVPRDFEKTGPLPVVLFLHGSGESGEDGVRQTAVGLGPAVLQAPARWPAIVIFPQKPSRQVLWPELETPVLEMLQTVLGEFHADRSRVYLTGLSQGGHGAWMLAAKHPELFAALVPVCGFGEAKDIAEKVKDLPIWAFHGLKDDVVPPKATIAIIDAIKAAGGKPELTLYPEVNHFAWVPAYGDEKLAAWLFAQRKK